MELDFDKEIDALIRRERAARTITIGEFVGLHPDADEIAAFLENAVPASARKELIGHFAGCDACRQTLSNTIALNAEIAPPGPERIAAPVETVVPWYRRLFLFPNLAYVMGGLIVLFGGFIGLSVFTTYQNRSSDVSQMRSSEQQPAAAPADSELFGNANTMSAAANTNAASAPVANTTSNLAVSNTVPATSAANSASNTAAAKDQNFSLDGVSVQPQQQPAPAGAPAKNEPKPAERSVALSDRDKKAATTATEKESKREEQSLMARSAPAPASSPMKKTDSRAAEADVSSRRADELPVAGRATDPNRKQVSGKTFEYRQGAWYDTVYRGQGTINVRRHTDAYRKLDGGLRGIAESFFGTVITTWNGKAYRIY